MKRVPSTASAWLAIYILRAGLYAWACQWPGCDAYRGDCRRVADAEVRGLQHLKEAHR